MHFYGLFLEAIHTEDVLALKKRETRGMEWGEQCKVSRQVFKVELLLT